MICGSTRSAQGVTHAALEELRRALELVRAALEVLAHVGAAFQERHRLEELDAVEVVHRLGFAMVALDDVVAGEGQDVLDAQHEGVEQVALERQAVAVAADHLEDRLDAGLDELGGNGQRAQPHDGRLEVGDVDGRHLVLHHPRAFDAHGACPRLWAGRLRR